jgi:membrane protein YqaA with SNARE-associated domain
MFNCALKNFVRGLMLKCIQSSAISFSRVLQKSADRIWYLPALAVLIASDVFIFVIPSEGLLMSSSMLQPRKWLPYSVAGATGTAVGAWLFGLLARFLGESWLLNEYPSLFESRAWQWSVEFFDQFGLWVVFVTGLSPFPCHPAVILVALGHSSLLSMAAVLFLGRLTKYILLTYLASHAPRTLGKLWGIQRELKDVGIKAE